MMATPSRGGSTTDTSNPAAIMVAANVPGIQYKVTDPETLQKYLIVLIQALSGTNPSSPPSYSPELNQGGKSLKIQMPVSPVLLSNELLTHENCPWMKTDSYQSDQSTRTAALGPAIAELRKAYAPTSPYIEWEIPLSESCSEVIGNFSISNFPVQPPSEGCYFYPIIVEFKLKLEDQSVDHTAKIKSSIWGSNGANKKARLDDPAANHF